MALASALVAVAATVLASPFLMVLLPPEGDLPWRHLADIGQAYGGASATLSAAALCGVVASLLYQRRQIRQQLAEMDRQQHLELMRIALENPELLEVLDARMAGTPEATKELFANLMMMYWLSVWELGEVDDTELRNMSANMFGSDITRRWWSRVGDVWIGTSGRPERRRSISIVTEELSRAKLTPAVPPAVQLSSKTVERAETPPAPHSREFAALAVSAVIAGLSAVAAQSFYIARRGVKADKGART